MQKSRRQNSTYAPRRIHKFPPSCRLYEGVDCKGRIAPCLPRTATPTSALPQDMYYCCLAAPERHVSFHCACSLMSKCIIEYCRITKPLTVRIFSFCHFLIHQFICYNITKCNPFSVKNKCFEKNTNTNENV